MRAARASALERPGDIRRVADRFSLPLLKGRYSGYLSALGPEI